MPESSLKAHELHRMKTIASGLLLGAIIIFVIATYFEQYYWWVGFIRATAEAAMVGAIADWFAVTALFRHPLGLKSPHTAIIPAKKPLIADSFGKFVHEKFLSEEAISQKIHTMHIAQTIAEWLREPENSAKIAHQITVGIGAVAKVMRDEDIQALIEYRLIVQVRSTEFAPLLGKLVALLTSGTRQQDILHGLVKFAADFLKDNKPVLVRKINQELPTLLRIKGVDEAIFKKLIEVVDNIVQDLNNDPNHPLYENFGTVISNYIDDLQESPEIKEKEKELKEELLEHPVVQAFIASLWTDIKNALIQQRTHPNKDLRRSIQLALCNLGETILNDEVLFKKVDIWFQEAIIYLINLYGHEIESLIANTIHNWDTEQTSKEIELQVGRDLQFIRINGTIIGGLTGLVIYTLFLGIKQLW